MPAWGECYHVGGDITLLSARSIHVYENCQFVGLCDFPHVIDISVMWLFKSYPCISACLNVCVCVYILETSSCETNFH